MGLDSFILRAALAAAVAALALGIHAWDRFLEEERLRRGALRTFRTARHRRLLWAQVASGAYRLN